MASVRTLVVEDHPLFIQFLCSELEKNGCQIIAQAADGLDAVKKAEELKPDLILLDLGLPKLNGIEVLRRVHKLSPESKILVVSQDSSSEIVQAALRLGANGYLLKSDAADLQLAVDAVLQGKEFISGRR